MGKVWYMRVWVQYLTLAAASALMATKIGPQIPLFSSTSLEFVNHVSFIEIAIPFMMNCN
jgi:hypothetical protein